MFQTARLLRHASYWLLENLREQFDIERAVRRYAAPVAEALARARHGAIGRRRRASRALALAAHRAARARAARNAHRLARNAALRARPGGGRDGGAASRSATPQRPTSTSASASGSPGSRSRSRALRSRANGRRPRAAPCATICTPCSARSPARCSQCKGRDAAAGSTQWVRRRAAPVDDV